LFAKAKEKLAVSKQESQKFDEGRFNPRKLNELEFRKQYKIKNSKRFAYLGNLNENEDINRDWEGIKENIKTSAKERLGVYELKKHKPRFDEECLLF
jgi:hypothetical protein